MNDFYTACMMMVVCSMGIMLVSIKFNIGLTKKRKHASALLFALIIIGTVCEWSGIQLENTASTWIPLHIFVKTVELSFSPFIGLMCVRCFAESRTEKWLSLLLYVNLVLEIISAFTGWIFYVDTSNTYHHGTFYAVYLISYLAGMLYFVVRVIHSSRQFQGNYGMAIMLVVIFVVACIATQLCNSTLRIDWLAIAIAAIMLYKFYGDMLLQIDGLTGLLNRWSYERTVECISKEAVILFFDVDKFKRINDTYGHSKGDVCLKKIAGCIQKVYGSYGSCFRYGGDEFCVVMDRALDHAEQVSTRFYEEVDRMRQNHKWLPTVSYGYAKYDPAVDDIKQTLKKADDRMYHYKEEHS